MFAIFVPGTSLVTEETLRELGCGPLLDATVSAMKIDATVEGPGGEAGQLFYVEQPGSPRRPLVSVDLATQTWTEASRDGEKPPGRYWLGYWTDDPPAPDDLQRPTLIDGQLVELCDGRQWAIPVADFLPKRLTFDRETGEETEVVATKHEAFTVEANRLFEHFLSEDLVKVVEGEHVVSVPNGLRFAIDALAVNYRVNRDLVDMLGLIGKHEAFAVAEVATGLRMIGEASQKKTLLSEVCKV